MKRAHEFFKTVWDRENHIVVILDPRVSGVKLPERFFGQVSLQLDIRRGEYAHSMLIGEFGFAVSLYFSGKEFSVYVPWDAIYLMQDTSRGVILALRMNDDRSGCSKPIEEIEFDGGKREGVAAPVPVRRRTKHKHLDVIDGGGGKLRSHKPWFGGNGGGPNVA